LSKKGLLIFFVLPFIGIIVLISILSTLNRNFIRARVEELVEEQLGGTAEILRVNISERLEEGLSPQATLRLYKSEESIYYMALLDKDRDILDWVSQFEGYLPLSRDRDPARGPWIINSPVGKIYNQFSTIEKSGGETYYLYLGYSLSSLEEMLAHSRRSFYVLFSVIMLIGLLLSLGLYRLQSQFLAKQREAESLRRDRERFREISAFTSGVAHEIKNPLNSLALLCELLHKKAGPDLKEDILAGKRQVQKIASVIDRFSSTLKPFKLDRESIPVGDLLRDVLDSLRPVMDKKNIGLDIQQGRAAGARIWGDRDLLSQALSNLLENAADSMEGGQITINIRSRRRRVEIRISDQGPGIAPENRDRIFQPFFSTKKEGMGIGLYLTKRIVQAHKGRIDFFSAPGQGVTFRLDLPGG
jgi:signal transduction histidine kinase